MSLFSLPKNCFAKIIYDFLSPNCVGHFDTALTNYGLRNHFFELMRIRNVVSSSQNSSFEACLSFIKWSIEREFKLTSLDADFEKLHKVSENSLKIVQLNLTPKEDSVAYVSDGTTLTVYPVETMIYLNLFCGEFDVRDRFAKVDSLAFIVQGNIHASMIDAFVRLMELCVSAVKFELLLLDVQTLVYSHRLLAYMKKEIDKFANGKFNVTYIVDSPSTKVLIESHIEYSCLI